MEPLRILQIHRYSDVYLGDFRDRHPEVELASRAAILNLLQKDGHEASQILAWHLDPDHFDARLAVSDFAELARASQQETGGRTRRRKEPIAEQIRDFQPDVIYLSSPVAGECEEISRLFENPCLMVGRWTPSRASGIDWGCFDLLVSDHDPGRSSSPPAVAIPFTILPPGYPAESFQPDEVDSSDCDVSCFGSWEDPSGEDGDRSKLLLELAKATLGQPREFDPGFFIQTSAPSSLPAGVSMYRRPPCFGAAAIRAMRGSRICVGGFANETTSTPLLDAVAGAALGVFQLVREDDSISANFSPGAEIETFSNTSELLDKIIHYLDHPEALRKIAENGRERCLREHTMSRRAGAFGEFVSREVLKRGSEKPRIAPPRKSKPGKRLETRRNKKGDHAGPAGKGTPKHHAGGNPGVSRRIKRAIARVFTRIFGKR